MRKQRGALHIVLTGGYWIGGAVAFVGLLLARLAGPPEWNLIGLGVMVAGIVVMGACYKLREGGDLNKFTYNLSQDYLEVARGVLVPIHGKVPSGAEKPEPSSELMNAVFGVVSISIVYSFLALESFLNYQLFRIWEKRGESTAPAKRFVAEFGDVSEFVRLKNHDKFRELPDRLGDVLELLEIGGGMHPSV